MMDNYSKRLVLCFSEKLDQAKLGFIQWDSFRLMALRATFQQCNGMYNEEVFQKYLEQSKLWWDSLVKDVGTDSQGRVHYIDMANFVREMTKETTSFEQLPEFIRNLANLVFLMNDRKGDGIWDLDEYRNGCVQWCRYVTNIAEIDSAYDSLLSEEDRKTNTITFDRYKQLVLEFFTSVDPETKARHIFGPLELSNINLTLTNSSKQ